MYVSVMQLLQQGNQKQQKRTSTFFEFCSKEKGILCCTDVAARGLDIPSVDWIIQFDPPDDPKEYIHRVGRTARAGGRGKALLFLLPEELGFLNYLRRSKIPLNEFEFPKSKLANVQQQLESLVERNYYLNKSAREGYRSYLLAYASHSLKVNLGSFRNHIKEIFDVFQLDLQRVSKGFGFLVPPRVNLNISAIGHKGVKRGDGPVAADAPMAPAPELIATPDEGGGMAPEVEQDDNKPNVVTGSRKRDKTPRGTGAVVHKRSRKFGY